jgi:hypothetical protein
LNGPNGLLQRNKSNLSAQQEQQQSVSTTATTAVCQQNRNSSSLSAQQEQQQSVSTTGTAAVCQHNRNNSSLSAQQAVTATKLDNFRYPSSRLMTQCHGPQQPTTTVSSTTLHKIKKIAKRFHLSSGVRAFAALD